MPFRLDNKAADFAQRFEALLAVKREAAADVEQAVRAIIADVRTRGDKALIELTAKFDRVDLAKIGIRVGAHEIAGAAQVCDEKTIDALKFARDRIEAYHRRQLPSDDRFIDALGVELGGRWTPIDAVGLYV
ncbi:MAG TPA: histidinol dehydrogenase, partial [Pseudolabrys sp.]|nr:histidinol dehydrogenase [Pseudolabrys sp.]